MVSQFSLQRISQIPAANRHPPFSSAARDSPWESAIDSQSTSEFGRQHRYDTDVRKETCGQTLKLERTRACRNSALDRSIASEIRLRKGHPRPNSAFVQVARVRNPASDNRR
ncbi:unnamed protein product [Linum trigynum]|uniref:Uncharacterized protein n=1 Tax=Linum trigynum TaxID=586398 RepID=A0AAV2FBF0_9ROSI